MHSAALDVVSLPRPGQAAVLALRLPDGRLLDLQRAHMALRGAPSPHLRDATSLRLAASYGRELVQELAAAAPAEALVAS